MTDDAHSADILFVSGDLFIGSRVRGAVENGGWTMDVAGSGRLALERLQEDNAYRLVLVDLETPGLQVDQLMNARIGPAAVVAYGPHVHEQRLATARQAGCDHVLTRGQFDATLPALLTRLLAES